MTPPPGSGNAAVRYRGDACCRAGEIDERVQGLPGRSRRHGTCRDWCCRRRERRRLRCRGGRCSRRRGADLYGTDSSAMANPMPPAPMMTSTSGLWVGCDEVMPNWPVARPEGLGLTLRAGNPTRAPTCPAWGRARGVTAPTPQAKQAQAGQQKAVVRRSVPSTAVDQALRSQPLCPAQCRRSETPPAWCRRMGGVHSTGSGRYVYESLMSMGPLASCVCRWTRAAAHRHMGLRGADGLRLGGAPAGV